MELWNYTRIRINKKDLDGAVVIALINKEYMLQLQLEMKTNIQKIIGFGRVEHKNVYTITDTYDRNDKLDDYY